MCDGLLPGWGSTWFLGKLYCLTTSVRTNGRHACIDKPVFGGRFMAVVWLSLHLFHVLDVLVHQWDKSPMFCEGEGVSETFTLDQLYEGEGHFSTMVREQCTTPIDVECLWGELENLNLDYLKSCSFKELGLCNPLYLCWFVCLWGEGWGWMGRHHNLWPAVLMWWSH